MSVVTESDSSRDTSAVSSNSLTSTMASCGAMSDHTVSASMSDAVRAVKMISSSVSVLVS